MEKREFTDGERPRPTTSFELLNQAALELSELVEIEFSITSNLKAVMTITH